MEEWIETDTLLGIMDLKLKREWYKGQYERLSKERVLALLAQEIAMSDRHPYEVDRKGVLKKLLEKFCPKLPIEKGRRYEK